MATVTTAIEVAKPVRTITGKASVPVIVKSADANRTGIPALGVRRFALRNLLFSDRCGVDFSQPHRLHFHVAILITAGTDNHMVDFAPVPLQPDDLLLLRAGQVHGFGKERAVDGEVLTFTDEFAGAFNHLPGISAIIAGILNCGPRLALSRDSAAAVKHWYEDLSSDMSARGKANADTRIALAFGLLIHRLTSLQEFLPNPQDNHVRASKLMRDFEKLLDFQYASHRETAWYAKQLHVSPRTLDRQLSRGRNQTAKDLIRARVMLEAKRLLADPDLQIKDVGYALRFDDLANFSRFFRRNAGITPREFKLSRRSWV